MVLASSSFKKAGCQFNLLSSLQDWSSDNIDGINRVVAANWPVRCIAFLLSML